MDAPGIRERAKVALTRSPRLYKALRRPYAAGRFYCRRPHDGDYAAFGLFTDRPGVFLDVGANAGMSALSFRIYNRSAPIISIEPNPFHGSDLRFAGRLAQRHSYHLWAAGAKDDEMTLYVPVYRGVPLTAEASLIRDEAADSWNIRRQLGARIDTPDFQVIEHRVPVRALDCLQLDPAFIKLDVQGYEHNALLGLRKTLSRCRPVLLIEAPDASVRALLASYGYDALSYRRGSLVPAQSFKAPNTLFVA